MTQVSAATQRGGTLERATIGKLTRRFIPVIIVAYFVAYIDRVNLGMIKTAITPDLGLTDLTFGLASGLIFIGLIFFEIPSNRLALKFGSRRWITRIMASWGVVVMAGSLVQNVEQLYVMRVLLGLAEAGMAPAVFLYLAQWFPGRYRARALGLFFLSAPLAMAFGSPLTGWILESTHDLLGVTGWRWVFLIEGFAAILVAPLVLKHLVDTPNDARFLTTDERTWLTNELAAESAQIAEHTPRSFGKALIDGRVLLFAVTFLLLGYGTNALVYWLPTIVGEATQGLSPVQIGFVSAIPFVCAAIGIYTTGRLAEITGARLWNVLIPLIISVVGFAGSIATHNIVLTIAAISVALMGALAAQPQFWTLPSAYLTGASAAGGIAMINSVNNIGGFAGPFSFGWFREISGGSDLLPLVAMLIAQALACGGIIIAHRARLRDEANTKTRANAVPTAQPERTTPVESEITR